MTWRKEKKTKKGPRALPIVAVVVVVLGFVVYYLLGGLHGAGPSSNLVSCDVLSYGVFSAVTIVNGKSSTENFTETTGSSYTTTTSVTGQVGSSTITGTSYGATSGFVSYGASTRCIYVSSTKT